MRFKKLRDQVIVITGASTGIGLTTADMAVARGARVVLAARSEPELAELTEQLNQGAPPGRQRAIFVAVDISDPNAAERIAEAAQDAFGGVDTWVNNAGVSVYGRIADVRLADMRRVFETNFWGTVHGCRVAVELLRQRGGVIINMGSVVSDVALPLQGIYSASKHAVKGFTDALRLEVEAEGLPIRLTLVKPGPIDTPYTEHARNYLPHEPTHQPPVYAPEAVAEAILRCAERPVRDIVVGGASRVMSAIARVAPRMTDLYLERMAFGAQQREDVPADDVDSLYEPSRDVRRHGSYPGRVMRSSAYTRAMLSDVGRAAPLVAIGALVAAGVAAARRGSRAGAGQR
ncbi:MAG: SDR family oxidoreductase [Vicinamibacterales bacterium]